MSLVFVYFLVPETKGLSLEQCDRMLEESSPRNSAKWVPHSTFASDMGLTDKAVTNHEIEHPHSKASEKVTFRVAE